MKKHLVATLLVAVMCLLTLSACSVVAGLENDVNITLNVNGNALDGNYVVNTFNNAIVPVPEAPKGDVFLGWTVDKDWQNKEHRRRGVVAKQRSYPLRRRKGLRR